MLKLLKMKSNIFIFHGTEGHPQENWFPWLKGKLEAKGCKVFVPQFPTPPVVPAKISEWFDVLKEYEKHIAGMYKTICKNMRNKEKQQTTRI